jgi:hypothetical protein
MNNLLHQELRIPVPFLKEEFNQKKYSYSRHQQLDRQDVSDEYYKWLDLLNLKLSHAETFYSIPDQPYPIHKDTHNLTDFPKINWVFGNSISTMNWYKVLSDNKLDVGKTGIDTRYVGYKLEDVELIHSIELPSPSLIQAGTVHNVTTKKDFRWSISTVYTHNNKLLTFNEMVEILKPFVV